MTGGEREVVKLSIGEGQPPLNVLPVGLEGDTLTLVCPFPMLPIELPVNVTLPGEDSQMPVAATIRRVGVELMGEVGIPRFKLQVDLSGSKPQTSTEKDPEVVDDGQLELNFEAEGRGDAGDREAVAPVADPAEAVVEELAEEEIPDVEVSLEAPQDEVPEIPAADMSWTAGEMFGKSGHEPKTLENPMLTWGDRSQGKSPVAEDPPWVAEHDPQVVHAALDDSERRRARWPIRAAIVLTLLVSALAVGYEMREQIAPLVSPFLGEELTLAALGMTPAAAPSVAVAPPTEASTQSSEVEMPTPTSIIDDLTETGAQEGSDTAATEEDELLPDPSVDATNDQLRVILPTRWPVTEARSYRLNEPTGIVVDVPGGMASERARWIDTAHERVRSVRVLEREDGVRFIIYLNDSEVPRYRVGYSRSGVTVDIMGPDPRHMASK